MKSLFVVISLVLSMGFAQPLFAYSGYLDQISKTNPPPAIFLVMRQMFFGAKIESQHSKAVHVAVSPIKFTFTVSF